MGPSSFIRRRWLAALVVVAACMPVDRVAQACPFCSAVSLTFAQEIAQAEAAVVARLVTPPPTAALGPTATGPLPQGVFEVVQVLKGSELIEQQGDGGKPRIETILLEEKPVGSLFLLLGVESPKVVWSSPIAINEQVVEYLQKLPGLPASGPDRLAFFQGHLEDPDPILARDAYDEFAVAPYADVKGLKQHMDPKQLLTWIRDPAVQANRRRLYATMLGVCGLPDDAAEIATILEDTDADEVAPDVRTGLDALIACYVTLRGTDGLDLVDRLFLKRDDREVPFTETYAAVMALRFLGEESEIVPRERVLASLRLLLNEPKLADLVIADLARWQDWSVIEKLTTLFKEAGSDNIFVREPVVNYLKACPLPEAAEALAACEAIDPQAVRRAATLAGFGAAFAAQSPPADGDAAAAAVPAGGDEESEGDVGAIRPAGPPQVAAAADKPIDSAADAEVAARVIEVLGDEDATDSQQGSTSAVPPLVTRVASPPVAPVAEVAWGRWLVWAAIVAGVGLLARSALRTGAAPPR